MNLFMDFTRIFHFLALCPTPIAPTHGRIQGKDFRHGQSIKFSCSRGFTRVGASSVTCNKGKWGEPFPVCKGQNRYLLLAIAVNSAMQYISTTFSYVGFPEPRKSVITTGIYKNLIF